VNWREFGYDSRKEPALGTYTKYYADFIKNLYWGKFSDSGFELAYYGGDHLDRFSRYRPSLFSQPRIRGIPIGTDSFDDIFVASASHSLKLSELVKFQGIYNHAWVRNTSETSRFSGFHGLELDFGTTGPWGTYLQGIVTYALSGNLGRYETRWGVYILLFKPLG
jgi:hypothetical protein